MVLLFHFMWKEEKLDFLMVSLHKTQIKKKSIAYFAERVEWNSEERPQKNTQGGDFHGLNTRII